MPNAINIYSTREMMKAINLMKPAHTFLRDTFFNRTITFVTNEIDVDFKKGKRKMAPFVAPRAGGIVMDRQGYKTNSYKVPKIAPERITTVEDLSKRSMGESIYSTKTPAQRAAEITGQDLAELDEYITRREEWMCREVLINGKVIMKGIIDDRTDNTVDEVVDYNMTQKETLSGSDAWTDSSNSDPHEDLKKWRQAIIKSTGKSPNVVVMASDVASVFINHPKVQKINDISRFNFGMIQPAIKSPAVTLIGYLADLGLEIYQYDEWFIDDEGNEQPMMPEKHLIMGRTGMAKRLYGAITQIEDSNFVTIEGMRIPKMYVDSKNDTTNLRLSSKPLPAPDDIDDWYVAIVC
jgi:hypothetical protein